MTTLSTTKTSSEDKPFEHLLAPLDLGFTQLANRTLMGGQCILDLKKKRVVLPN